MCEWEWHVIANFPSIQVLTLFFWLSDLTLQTRDDPDSGASSAETTEPQDGQSPEVGQTVTRLHNLHLSAILWNEGNTPGSKCEWEWHAIANFPYI
jgi:hypothetical protein